MSTKQNVVEHIYDLTPMQEGMLFHSLFSPDSLAYIELYDVLIEGELDLPKFEQTFQLLVNRHQVLKTMFLHTKLAKPRQVVLKNRSVKIEVLDYSDFPDAASKASEFYEKQKSRKFDLAKDPLIRLDVLILPHKQFKIIWAFHHIIMDGWCFAMLFKEFFAIYESLLQGKEPDLPEPADYGVYLKWLAQQNKKEAELFWKKQNSLLDTVTPLKKASSSNLNFELQITEFIFPLALKEKIEQFAAKQSTSVNVYLQSIWSILLQKLNNTQSSMYGTVVSGRPTAIPDVDNIIGLFINTIPVCADFSHIKTFREAIQQLHHFFNESKKYDYFPLAETLNILPNELRRLEHIFSYESIDKGEDYKENKTNLGFDLIDVDAHEQTNLDLDISVHPKFDHLLFKCSYNALVFDKNDIDLLEQRLYLLISQTLENPDIALADLDVLSEQERHEILVDFNSTQVDYPLEESFVSLFEKQAAAAPEKTALVFKDKSLSYAELNTQSNQLAHFLLQEHQLKAEDLVAIQLPKSLDLLVAVLGVMKTGAAYVPIDPDYPQERIDYMLSDSQAKLVLDEAFVSRFLTVRNTYSTENTAVSIKNSDLAYVIYTSGSTGLPKGVMVEQHSLVNVAQAWQKAYGLDSMEVNLLQMASFSFDVFVGDMLRTFVNGGTMVLCPPDWRLDPVNLSQALIDNKISLLEATPGLIIPLMDYVWEQKIELPDLKLLILGSDTCPLSAFTLLQERFGKQIRIVNSYGVTEATIDSSFFEGEVLGQNLPIGKPLQNTQYFVLDAHHKPVPLGTTGELYIGGAGIARGYLNKPELTAERFVYLPELSNQKLYKTGDLAYWQADANLVFVGRADAQVKIRGYRIELGEIENQLLSLEGIKEAAVVDLKDNMGVAYLCAYLKQSEKQIGNEYVKTKLSEVLPDYMIPAYFVQVDNIPLTPNGKVDKKALPAPDASLALANSYEAPRNETEEKLAAIWQEILGVERIGINDNFFELGGHSLKAMVLVSRIHKELEVKISLQKLFEKPSIAGIIGEITGGEKDNFSSIQVAPKQAYYPLSAAQKRMFMLHELNPESTAYNMPTVLRLDGKLDLSKLQNALQNLVKRHEALRTSFALVEDKPVQFIADSLDFQLEIVSLAADQVEDNISAFVQPFDLATSPLLRMRLLALDELTHYLLIDMHHIISDGVTSSILVNDFSQLYQGKELAPLRIQYKDFAHWQQDYLQGEKAIKQQRFWLDTFSDTLPLLNLPTDFPRPLFATFEGAAHEISLSPDLSTQLEKLVQQQGATLYMLLLAAYNVLLSKFSGQDDIIVGSPIAGRPHADLEQVAGVFINTLAQRNFPSGEKRFVDFLNEVKERSLLAFENQDFPFDELVGLLDLKRDTSRNPLFDTLFVMQNTPEEKLIMDDIQLFAYDNGKVSAKFDITLQANQNQGQFFLNLQYNIALFKPDTIARFAASFIRILEQIVANPGLKISEIDVLSEAEKQQLLVEFNPAEVAFPEQETILSLFEKQVLATPNNVALVFEDKSLTYTELNALSNQLAHCILEKTAVSPDDKIAILLDRSEWMVVSVLAVLKTGGCYVPIDPSYPQERIDFMQSDSGAKLVVDEAFVSRFLTAVPDGRQVKNLYSVEKTNTSRNPHDLAYIIYTSGSTGQPKGVMIEDQQVVRLLFNEANLFDFSSTDVWTLFHSYCFDFSVWEMYGALLFGGKLVVVPKIVAQSTPDFRNLVQQQGVTVLNQTPGSFYNFIPEELSQNEAMLSLRYVIFGGEALSPAKLAEFKSRYPQTKLINMYGITETTVHVTYKEITETEIEAGISNIGVAIPTLQTYILDANLKLVPIGVAGELCVGGAGLARGYLNREELTAEKFVNHPWIPNEKLYRSGDLARLLPSGELEYLGRIDQQVKIRGFRIELGEVEAKMLALDIFQDVVVIDKKDKDSSSYLVAYFTAKESHTAGEIRQQLTGLLPDYMLPSFFVQLESIPLTSNGKVDRKALPEPDGSLAAAEYIAPRNETEQKLAEIWQELLGIENRADGQAGIGINDNFFELGGHSLKAMVLVSRIHKELEVKISLQKLFELPTIAGISGEIIGGEKDNFSSIKPAPKQDYYPLSAAQKRMFMLHELNPESTAYNMPTVLRLEGKLDLSKLQNAVQNLLKRHEALRTSFTLVEDKPVQFIADSLDFQLEIVSLAADQVDDNISFFVEPFDLATSPLLRMRLLEVDKLTHYLLIDMHHIISDGVTSSILVNDFSQLYQGKELAPLRIQYKDFAHWQQDYLQGEKAIKQQRFWLDTFSGELPLLNLPTDFPRPLFNSFEGAEHNLALPEDLSSRLENLAREKGATLYMLLLAAYNVLLSKFSGQDDIIVGSPIAGRPHADLEQVAGVFINTLAQRNFPSGEKRFADFLEEVKERSLLAFENQDFPFDELVGLLDLKRDTSRNPLFDTLFVMQNTPEEKLIMDDVSLFGYSSGQVSSKFDITLQASQTGKTLELRITYGSALFTTKSIEHMFGYFKQILEEIVVQPNTAIQDLMQISEQDKNLILNEFNATELEVPKNITLVEQFEKTTAEFSNQIALVFEGTSYTYAELNALSNQFAAYLRKNYSIEPNNTIAVKLESSEWLIITILSILKSGAGYTPIDPNYPQERINFMLQDSGSKVLIDSYEIERFQQVQHQFSTENPSQISKAGDLAYIIYTSGSTGTPKGVLVNHRSVVNLIQSQKKNFGIDHNERILQFSNIAFDASVEQIFLALTNGGALNVVRKETVLDSDTFEAYVREQGITHVHTVPSVLKLLPAKSYPALRRIIAGGDNCPKELAESWGKHHTFINEYGPTETTVTSIQHVYTEADSNRSSISIGKPLHNTFVYIMDHQLQLLPVGIAGEICIGGAGVSNGYLNRPELTNEKFVPNRFRAEEKMYRTGDLARWLPDGSIEYLGRIDQQVKIKGYRIELGEIESCLMQLESVKEVLVTDRLQSSGDKYLAAYVVASTEADSEQMREHLLRELPYYMVPTAIVLIDHIPLNANGKVNRQALPEPPEMLKTGGEYLAPRNEIEEILVQIWQDVLKTKTIGIKDDFFALGGDSIKGIQVSSRLRQQQYTFELRDLFQFSTIEQLSKQVKRLMHKIDQSEVTGEVMVSPIQHNFFETIVEENHYNQAVMLFSSKPIEVDLLQEALAKLIAHHDALRLKYSDGKLWNLSIKDCPFQLQVVPCEASGELLSAYIEEKANEVQRSMNIQNGEIFKSALFQTKQGDHLLLAAHHLSVDGVSWRILLEDLQTAYNQLQAKQTVKLPLKTDSFQYWSAKLNQYASSGTLLKELPSWKQLENLEIHNLPQTADSEPDKSLSNTTSFEIDEEQTELLLTKVHRAYHTEVNDVLLTALALAMKEWTGKSNTLICLEGHGREEIVPQVDVSRTVAWFTSLYPVVLQVNTNDDLGLQLQNIKENLRRIPNKGVGYNILKFLTPSELKAHEVFKLKPEISFNYLGQFENDDVQGAFVFSDMPKGNGISPKNKSDYNLDISGLLVRNKLSMSMQFNLEKFSPESINQLSQSFKNHLNAIITHCVEQTESIFTPSDYGYGKLRIEELQWIRESLNPGEVIQNIHRLTPMQEGMLFHTLLNSIPGAYFEQTSLKITGDLKIDLFEQSLNQTIQRHDILRTAFKYEKLDKPVQVVLTNRKTDILVKDLSGLNEEQQHKEIKAYSEADKIKGFDLSHDTLIRMTIFKTDATSYEVLWSHHHILMDGWCNAIVIGDFLRLCDAATKQKEIKLEDTVPYANYLQWLENQDYDRAKEYWRNLLSGYETNAIVPQLNKERGDLTFELQERHFVIEEKQTAALQQLAASNKVTINSIMQSIWGLLLQRYNSSKDVVFGSVVSGRPPEVEGVETIVGLFINTIPVRVQAETDSTFLDMLLQVQEKNLNATAYDFLPLAEIQAETVLKSELINNILVFENYPVADEIEKSNSEDMPFRISNVRYSEQTNYDLILVVVPHEQIQLNFGFNSAVYAPETIENISLQFQYVVNQIIENPEIQVKSIELMTAKEKDLLLQTYHNSPKTETKYPKNKTLAQLFEEQVLLYPDNIALDWGSSNLSYQELNQRSNQIAHYLIQKGLKTGSSVALMLHRSFDLYAAILGVLKAGASYLPLDPDFPEDRVKFMLEDSASNILLSHRSAANHLQEFAQVLDLDSPEISKQKQDNIQSDATSQDLAYIIYTSGSTGIPKGTRIRQYSVTRVVKDTNYITLYPEDSILQLSNYAFDGSVFDIFGALLNGGRLVILEKEQVLNLAELTQSIRQKQISVMFLTTALFNTLVDESLENLSGLRKILFGGERVSVPHAKKALEYLGKDVLLHVYGPTESTVFATAYPIQHIDSKAVTIPIGVAISNTGTLILDENRNLQAIGLPGELYLSGDGLALDYLNNPELTAQSFIDHPILPNGKLYKTGDLVKLLPDEQGNIEFIGRVDQQVKIRGFRIELGEIEFRLLQQPSIKEAVVVDLEEQGNKFLCAYIVADEELESEKVLSELAKVLPEYMVPSYLMQLPTLPLNQNGKVDKKALPQPVVSSASQPYMAPQSPVQEKLLAIWSDLLGKKEHATRIGINDNFFLLGGHSLKAMVLTARIQQQFEVQISLTQVFNNPTISGLEHQILGSAKNHLAGIQLTAKKENYVLSSAQKRMYLLTEFDKQSTAYNIPFILKGKGKIQLKKLESALQQLIERHESLRTSFVLENKQPVQIIHPQIDFKLEQQQISSDAIEQTISSFIRPFDLTAAPLFRVALAQITEDAVPTLPTGQAGGRQEFLLLFDIHHIIADGVSMNLLVNEFVALYDEQNLPELSIQYKDFAEWQHDFLQSETAQKQEQYWIQQLGDELPVLSLPLDFTRPTIKSNQGETLGFALDKQLSQQWKNVNEAQQSTTFMSLLAVYQILLSKYSGQNDLLIGTPIAGRTQAELEQVVGMFVNTLVLRQELKAEQPFIGLLQEVKRHTLEAFENQEYPFDLLVEKLDLPRDMSRNPIFDVLFTVQNSFDASLELNDLQFSAYKQENEVAKFDLSLTVSETDEGLYLSFNYCTALFKPETIARFAASFIRILEQIVANPGLKISEIDVLSEAEKQQLLVEFNPAEVAFPEQETILSLFEKQVLATPDNVALVFEDKSLTYTELNALSNQLAHCILEKTAVSSDETIAILLDRSEWMVVSVLAVLKTGGCYVPIDPSYPQERIDFMLSDSGAKLVVDEAFVSRFLTAVPDGRQVKNLYSVEKTGVLRNPHDLAYIIYTSGSTGQPKGVMIEDQQVVRLLFNEANLFDFSATDVWTLFHSYCFDFSVWEMYGALLFGGKLVVVPKIVAQSTPDFRNLVQQQGVTVLNQTPGSFYNFIPEELSQNEAKLSLRYVIFGGEALSPAKLAEFKSRYPKTKLINMYGITETTVHVTYKEITETEIEAGISNIGVAIPTLQTYILDANLNLVPIGVAGELCVGGAGLARGYLNREELTAEKFVDSPFKTGKKLYRSGDLARLLPSGELEYLGRIDQQVKIRGFRIELGEVEAKMLTLGIFQDVVVIDKKDKDSSSYLVAYFTAKESHTAGEIRQQLTGLLPDYMLPSYFVQLESIPLTSNGKVDRKALPEPKNLEQNGTSYLPPRNETEQKLAEIWQEVLGIERVGINHNFFELGGHSLKAVQLAHHIQPHFGIDFGLKEVFGYPSILEQAMFIESGQNETNAEIVALEKSGHYPLSYAQQRLWMMSKMGQGAEAFNVPFTLKVSGQLDKHLLTKALGLVCKRHEALRTGFIEQEGVPAQKIDESIEIPVLVKQAPKNADEEEIKDWIKTESQTLTKHVFDLRQAPLWKLEVLQINETEHYLLFNFHHIISDGWSINVFSNDMLKAYSALKNDPNFELPPLEIQYKDFAVYQNKLIQKQSNLNQYWKTKLANAVSVLNLPEAKTRPATKTFNGALYRFKLNEDIAKGLKQLTQQLKLTEFVVMRSLLNLWLYQKTAQQDIIVGTPVAGRGKQQTQEIMGYFINTLPLRDYLDWSHTVSDIILQIKNSTLEALKHESYPLDKMLQDISYERDASRSPLFDIGLSWQNFDDVKKDEKLDEIRFSQLPIEASTAKYDLWLFGNESETGFNLMWEYNSDLFDAETIEKYAEEFIVLAQNMPSLLDKKLIELRNSTEILVSDYQPGRLEESTGNEEDNSFDFNF